MFNKLNFAVCVFCAFVASFLACPVAIAAEPITSIPPQNYVVPEQDDISTSVSPDNDALTITGSGSQKTVIIPLDGITVQPNTEYHVRYQLRADALQETANVYLLVREHEAEKAAPIKPYHVESVRYRDLQPETSKKWHDHWLHFKTGAKTQALSGSIVVVKLKGTLSLSAFEVWDDAGYTAYQNVAETAKDKAAAAASAKAIAAFQAQAAARKPLTPRPLVFSRSQMKYALGKNYYHEWNDRPLLASRDYRVASPYITPLPSYKRTLEEVRNYGLDGLAFFPETKDRMAMFEAHQEAGMTDLGLLPEFIPGHDAAALDAKTEILQRALKSTFAARIDGKVLITSYAASSMEPKVWKEVLDTLRQRVGDTFLFLPALPTAASLERYFRADETIPVEEIKEVKAQLRAYLDVCDGIYFHYPPALHLKDHTFDAEYYREILIPIMKSVLNEPPYRKKYLGLSAYKSHMSPDRGNNLFQDATRTLRNSFEAAMDAQPDVIVLPEWDEQNENTSWRPTTYGSRSNERIARYYMSRIKHAVPSPLPGDDTHIPNLIFSSRKIATVGENLMFELLNVPDGSKGNYSVQLTLQDANSKIVKSYDPVTFDAEKLQEHRLYLATETVPQTRALNPVLTVKGYKGRDQVFDKGFHAVQIRATWNWDYLYVNQPLREILRPVSATLQWEKPAENGGPLTLTGSVTSPEELNLVEVLGDDDEAYAVDPTDEFFRDDESRELIVIEYRSLNQMEMAGTLTLKNATAEWLTNGSALHQEETKTTLQQNQMRLDTPVWIHQRWIYLAVPKTDIAKGELEFNFDKAKFTVPLRKVLDKKMVARGFENGLHISLRTYHRQIDMPRSLNAKNISFHVQIWPEIISEQYHLRLTSQSGKIYRTRPVLLPDSESSKLQTLRVYSEAQKKGVDVQVAENQIPHLNYDFDPERGAVLLTDAGRPFWATLGGFSNSTTGRGTSNALFRGKYPEHVQRSAPQWITEQNKPGLEFDGVGTYLELPREALPSRSSFTLAFEIKPDSAKDQGILVNGTVARQRGLALEIRDGNLWASFRDADWQSNVLDTGLAIPANQWSQIEVRYDFEKMTFTVNGKSASMPSTFPALNIGYTVIGVSWNKPWFSGQLRNLRIVHNAGND